MRYGRTRAALAIAAASIIAGLVMAGCATIPHDPLYDGEDVPNLVTLPDSVTFVRLTIVNHRVQDGLDPEFSILGTGRHPLGIVHGMGGIKVTFIDTRWFAPDGCITVIAHYVGRGDWTFPKACYSPGYVFDVSLQEIFATSTAWAHPA